MAETFTPDNLIAGDHPVVTEDNTILTGEAAMSRGAVLGRVTASGKMRLCNSANADGSENPYSVLLKDQAAAAADIPNVPTALCGEFNREALSFGGTDTYADHVIAMRDKAMYQKAPVKA